MARELADSVRGAIWGLAAGDALGATVEFLPRAELERRGPHTEIIGGGWLGLQPGEFTDDTEMALATAMGIIEDPAEPRPAVGRHFIAWYRSNPPDVGNTVRIALNEYLRSGDWDQAGARAQAQLQPRAAGNGALMRIAPVGLAYYRHPAARNRQARVLTAMTHSDPLCVFLSVAYCALVAACVGAVPDRARAYERALAHAVAAYPQSVPGSVLALLNDLPRLPYSRLRGSGYSLDTFTAAVWCFLHGETLEQAVVAAVNLGDDADTTGAVAGALAGCYYGFTGLPGRWADTVRHRERLERAVAGLLRVAQS